MSYIFICISLYSLFIYIWTWQSNIIRLWNSAPWSLSCFKLFMLHNSFDNQGDEINKTTFFYVWTYCLLRKPSSYYTFNKFTSYYHNSCIRLCLHFTLYILMINENSQCCNKCKYFENNNNNAPLYCVERQKPKSNSHIIQIQVAGLAY